MMVTVPDDVWKAIYHVLTKTVYHDIMWDTKDVESMLIVETWIAENDILERSEINE